MLYKIIVEDGHKSLPCRFRATNDVDVMAEAVNLMYFHACNIAIVCDDQDLLVGTINAFKTHI